MGFDLFPVSNINTSIHPTGREFMSLISYLYSKSHSSPAEDPSEEFSEKAFEKSSPGYDGEGHREPKQQYIDFKDKIFDTLLFYVSLGKLALPQTVT